MSSITNRTRLPWSLACWRTSLSAFNCKNSWNLLVESNRNEVTLLDSTSGNKARNRSDRWLLKLRWMVCKSGFRWLTDWSNSSRRLSLSFPIRNTVNEESYIGWVKSMPMFPVMICFEVVLFAKKVCRWVGAVISASESSPPFPTSYKSLKVTFRLFKMLARGFSLMPSAVCPSYLSP